MSTIVELFSARSQNGRRGLAVVGPEGTTLPAEGSLRHCGRAAGLDTYEIVPGTTGTGVATAGDVTVHGGATLVAVVDLQAKNTASLLLLGPQAVVEQHDYARRGSRVVAYIAGVEASIPASVLVAMGLLPGGEVVAIEPPPVLGNTMAAAFAALQKRA